MANQPKDHDYQPLLDVHQNILGVIFGESVSIDTKCLALLGSNLAILIFIGQASLDVHGRWVWAILFGGYITSILLCVLALWPLKYIGAGVDLQEHPDYLELDGQDLVLQLLSDTELAINQNQKLNVRRWQLTLTSFILTGISTITLFVIM